MKELLDLDEIWTVFARELSLGQRMRANLALTFLHDPQLVLLDEPTLGLDVLAKRQMIGFIKRINEEKKATILVTSDCRKTLGELERAKALSNFNRAQRHVRWAREDFCGGKSHFPEQKSFPCSFCARKSERFQQKLVGVAVAGELASPSTSLSKILF
mgnify:CR=1 FL=1